jgi:hypothetical protein
MQRKQMSAVVLGLAWLASLGAVFVLGILSAFAFHLGPGAGAEGQGDLSLEQRELILTVERYAGRPVDVGALFSVTDDRAMPEQLETALRAILRLDNPQERQHAGLSLARGLPPRRVMGAIRFLQEIPSGPARDQVLERLLESWAVHDGRSAIAFATSLPSAREGQLAIGAVLRGWSTARPSDAWNWVIEREGASRRAERWLEVILANLGATDRETALQLLESMPARDFQVRMSLAVMEQILQTEPPREALGWLTELPRQAVGAAAAFLAETWAVTEPEAAAKWLSAAYPDETVGLANVIQEWAYINPSAAADWVFGQYNGPDRRVHLDLVAGEWIGNDGPAPLAQWINQRGSHRELDGAIEQLALAIADVDPAMALGWAQSILDADTRSMLEIFIGRQWIRANPEDAADSLPVLLESESARAALLEPAYELVEEVQETGFPETAEVLDEPPPEDQ